MEIALTLVCLPQPACSLGTVIDFLDVLQSHLFPVRLSFAHMARRARRRGRLVRATVREGSVGSGVTQLPEVRWCFLARTEIALSKENFGEAYSLEIVDKNGG